jgi:hypothetical protein
LGLRCQIAMRNASTTNCAFMRELMLQPTTLREYKSMTTAKYNQSSRVHM